MYQRGIRGAITVDSNTIDDIKKAVIELIDTIQKENNIITEDISHAIFTYTRDLDKIYPAKIAREEFIGWQNVPMVCFNEMDIENSLKKCLRILIVINTDKNQTDIKHVYLKGAKELRKDLSK